MIFTVLHSNIIAGAAMGPNRSTRIPDTCMGVDLGASTVLQIKSKAAVLCDFDFESFAYIWLSDEKVEKTSAGPLDYLKI